MLVLSRKIGQRIVLPQCGVTISVTGIRGRRVQVGICAPSGIAVFREGLLDNSDSAVTRRTPMVSAEGQRGSRSCPNSI